MPVAYVADGHHRTASACRVGRERRAANPQHTGNEDYNWFLAVLFPASQLQILPYNRAGQGPERTQRRHRSSKQCRSIFTRHAKRLAERQSSPARSACISTARGTISTGSPPPDADPISQLDVTGLQDRLLAPILGIDDPRTSKRIDFIGGIRGTGELVKLVDSGTAAVAFSMYPTTVEQLMAIADASKSCRRKAPGLSRSFAPGFSFTPSDIVRRDELERGGMSKPTEARRVCSVSGGAKTARYLASSHFESCTTSFQPPQVPRMSSVEPFWTRSVSPSFPVMARSWIL